MDFRNKWLVGTVRVLLALLLLGIGGSGLYFILSGNIPSVPGETEAIKAAALGLQVSGITIFAKVTELIVAVMLLCNFRPALANLLLAPVTVGVMLYDLVLWTHVPAALIPAYLLLAFNLYLGYVYWDKYKQLFVSN